MNLRPPPVSPLLCPRASAPGGREDVLCQPCEGDDVEDLVDQKHAMFQEPIIGVEATVAD